MSLNTTVFCLIAACSTVAIAASTAQVVDGLKKMNTDMCLQIGSNVPDAPKKVNLLAPYCGCVTELYWQSVPAAEQQELASKGTSAGIQKNLDARLAAAQGACKKKIGF
jgi:hypothetical protein